ncbi:hypothetical protein BC828DRAFT_373988, partial [Blastocladiella britannica]
LARKLAQKRAQTTPGPVPNGIARISQRQPLPFTFPVTAAAPPPLPQRAPVKSFAIRPLKSNGVDPVATLPVELLLIIFSLLPLRALTSSSGVSKPWRRLLAAHRYLWRDLDLALDCKNNIPVAAFAALTKRAGTHLRSLVITGLTTELTGAAWRSLALVPSHHPNLASLEIHPGHRCTAGGSSHLTASILATMVGPNLTSLRLPGCAGVNDSGLRVILAKSTRLESVDFSQCPNLDGNGFAPGGDEPVQPSSLRRVKLKGCRAFTSQGIHELAKHHPHVTELDLTACPHVTVTALSDLGIRRLRNLESLTLWNHASLTSEALAGTFEHLERLTTFYLLASRVVDHRVIAALGSSSAKTIPLRSLSLPSSAHASEADWIQLFARATFLEHLNAASCPGITPAALAHLPATLKSLDVSGLSAVTDAAVKSVAVACPDLMRLGISGTRVTEKGLQYAVALLPHLRHIDALRCPHISALALNKIRESGDICLDWSYE